MQRIRVIVRHDPNDPTDDLRWASRVRRDLWAHSPVEIDPDSPVHGTHRDENRNAWFEFATDHLAEVRRVLRDYGYEERVSLTATEDMNGPECVNCGNISPESVTVCTNCGFRDIDPCPICEREIARLAYLTVEGDLFQCPSCRHRVRFRFQDPMFDGEGHYLQPLVEVRAAEMPVGQNV